MPGGETKGRRARETNAGDAAVAKNSLTGDRGKRERIKAFSSLWSMMPSIYRHLPKKCPLFEFLAFLLPTDLGQ